MRYTGALLTTLLLSGCQSTGITITETRAPFLERYFAEESPKILCPTVARAAALAFGGQSHESCVLMSVDSPRFYDYWDEGGWSYPIYMVGPVRPGLRYYYWVETW